MEYVNRLVVFWYDFLIGDDPVGSLIIIAGFVTTYFVAAAGTTAYWVVLLSVLISLAWSLRRKTVQAQG